MRFDDNSHAAVPTLWLVGSNRCYWPPKPCDASKLANTSSIPDVLKWELHQCAVLKLKGKSQYKICQMFFMLGLYVEGNIFRKLRALIVKIPIMIFINYMYEYIYLTPSQIHT